MAPRRRLGRRLAGGGTAADNTNTNNTPVVVERPEPGVFRHFPWHEWMCSWLHNGGPTGALDKLIHGVISTPRMNNKASTLEHTLRGEMVIWASTADEAGRDALAKFFSTRPLYYSGLITAFGLTVNLKGKLERRAFTMDTSADDITHWFADHGLTVGEGDEILAWAKTYLERR